MTKDKKIKILVPTAGTEPARKNVKYVVNIAKRLRADLLALHIHVPGEEKPDKNCLEIFYEEGGKAGVPVWRVMWQGGIEKAIIMAAQKEGADLIIMGASKDKVVADWMSSNVAKRANTPVVIIPGLGKEYV